MSGREITVPAGEILGGPVAGYRAIPPARERVTDRGVDIGVTAGELRSTPRDLRNGQPYPVSATWGTPTAGFGASCFSWPSGDRKRLG